MDSETHQPTQDRRFVRTLHGSLGATTLTLVGAVLCVSALMQLVMLVLVAYSVASDVDWPAAVAIRLRSNKNNI